MVLQTYKHNIHHTQDTLSAECLHCFHAGCQAVFCCRDSVCVCVCGIIGADVDSPFALRNLPSEKKTTKTVPVGELALRKGESTTTIEGQTAKMQVTEMLGLIKRTLSVQFYGIISIYASDSSLYCSRDLYS